MELTWTGARFVLKCTPGDKAIPAEAGFHWDIQNKKWWTGLIDVARKFEQYADKLAKERFAREKEQIAMSKAVNVSVNMHIPVPAGLNYLGFQKAGIMYALQRKDTLIADEMRLGKSVQAIGVANADTTIKSILLICPAFLKINWAREFMRWSVRSLSGDFATSKMLPNSDIVIINYDIVGKVRKLIDARKWDLVIWDEAHYMKNPAAKRTLYSLGGETYGKVVHMPIEGRRRLFLTGTPILNRPVEIWPIVRICDPEGLGASHWAFVKRFCKAWEAPWGWDFSGHDNLDELQQRLRAKFMIRRLKSQVLPELPPIRRQIIPIPADTAKAVIGEEMKFYQENQATIELALANAKLAQLLDDEIAYKAATAALTTAKKISFQKMSELRHKTALAKVPYVIEHLENVLEGQSKVVCFAHHIDVIEAIAAHFNEKKRRAVIHHGGMSNTQRQESVDRFKDDDTCNLFVGGISCAVGYSAAVASVAIFAELSWVPGDQDQAEKRLDAIDQKNSILIQHICFDGSLDINMAQRVIEKQEVIVRAVG